MGGRCGADGQERWVVDEAVGGACARSAARVVADVVRGTNVGEGCCVPIARRGKRATAGTLAPTCGDGRDPNAQDEWFQNGGGWRLYRRVPVDPPCTPIPAAARRLVAQQARPGCRQPGGSVPAGRRRRGCPLG